MKTALPLLLTLTLPLFLAAQPQIDDQRWKEIQAKHAINARFRRKIVSQHGKTSALLSESRKPAYSDWRCKLNATAGYDANSFSAR